MEDNKTREEDEIEIETFMKGNKPLYIMKQLSINASMKERLYYNYTKPLSR